MSRFLTPAHVAAHFDVVLAPRYRAFLDDQEGKAYNGRFALVPHYATAMPLSFSGAELESFFHDDRPDADYGHAAVTIAKLGGKDGWVPLATLGTEEVQFLAVRANDPACPVAMWEQGTTRYVPIAASLDDLLRSLATGVVNAS